MWNKTTKTKQVLNHLNQYGTITSWQAIQQYGATRLSAIIFNLKKQGYNIHTITMEDTDRNGNTCQYAKYVLRREDNKNE